MDYTDLKQAFAQQAMDRDYMGTETCVAESTLSGIRSRILRFVENAYQIGHQLSDHADRMHGAAPQAAQQGKEANKPLGMLNEIFAALDRLEQAQSFLAEQAGRNCNIA